MKHIKLLGILTILIIITEFVLSIPSGMESFQEGMEAGMQEATACKNNAQTPLPHPIKVTVQVSPINAPLQTVTLNCGQNRTTQAVYATDSITCNISEPTSHAILTIIIIPCPLRNIQPDPSAYLRFTKRSILPKKLLVASLVHLQYSTLFPAHYSF